MQGNAKPPDYSSIWAKLEFQGFDPEILRTRRGDWVWYAEECLQKLEHGNTTVEADTSAGKTIIALLVSMALQSLKGWRTLFLTPQVELAHQHQELLSKLLATAAPASQVITGRIAPAKRDWSNTQAIWTFATPIAAWNDLQRRRLDLAQFDFIIFDEYHRGTGAYAYVPIAQHVADLGRRTLGLSATPGKKVEELRKTFSISEQVAADIATAPKTQSIIEAPVSETLVTIEKQFFQLFEKLSTALTLYGYPTVARPILSIREAKVLGAEIAAHPEHPDFTSAQQAFRAYFKLLYGYITVFAESYETFLDYVDRKVLQLKGHSKAADWILQQPEFARILTLAEQDRHNHPKTLKFMELCASLARAKQVGLAFFSQKATGRTLCTRLQEAGYAAEVIFGGSAKDAAHERSVLSQMKLGQVQFIMTTSTMEEGRNLPEVGAVIHYSMPLTAISRKQRSGRTGRIHAGTVVFICIQHSLDMVLYYATRERAQPLQTKIPLNILSQSLRHPTPTRRRRHKDTATLDLFQ